MKSYPEKSLSYEQVEKRKIEIENLEVGMFVCELDRPWESTPFVFQGFLLQSEKDIVAINKHCNWVYIDVTKSIHIADKRSAKTDNLNYPTFSAITVDSKGSKRTALDSIGGLIRRATGIRKKSRSFGESLKPSVETHQRTGKLIKSIMDEIKLGKSIDTPMAKEAVSACVDSVMHNKDAMLLLTRLRNKDQYTSEHSLNVAIIAIAFGRHLGMNRAQLNDIGLCGLLHDMGKMLTPQEILNKPGRLTKEEMKIMKQHPAEGRKILLASQDVTDEVIEVAFSHHERLNGTGYPRGIAGSNLSLYTRMICIADVFDAITGDRVYRSGRTAEKALSFLFLHKDSTGSFDRSLVIKFIENIGTYPLGTIVETHNGEVGIVVQNNPEHRLRPRIKLLLDEKKLPLRRERYVDLEKGVLDTQGQPYLIKTSHSPGSFGVDLTQHVNSYAQT